ncbi:class I SAM-dependent methyltransferase [Fibrella sp. HMF5335]|uniref:Class I SAM-dependent methyltransferase n=1 Tax=Fibrella rubiginis TaxID=2817060 RepID=A0A939K7C3_9BACT|nr:class I SAM-dependent methyltransferase [Fibrella rubiginis]MBO0939788.1 class I SAM-dependent methyltransferase [Fibrella rubiginis]
MFTDVIHTLPEGFAAIETASKAIRFSMPSDLQTGALLKALVGSKPGTRVLELGTGTGLATAWILAGMDAQSTLISIDNDAKYQAVADNILGDDARLQLLCTDAGAWLETAQEQEFDLIFADAWPGKYANLTATLNRLKTGGMYIIDDMLPQPNWPDGHGDNVDKLVAELETRDDLHTVRLAWSTGILIATKK